MSIEYDLTRFTNVQMSNRWNLVTENPQMRKYVQRIVYDPIVLSLTFIDSSSFMFDTCSTAQCSLHPSSSICAEDSRWSSFRIYVRQYSIASTNYLSTWKNHSTKSDLSSRYNGFSSPLKDHFFSLGCHVDHPNLTFSKSFYRHRESVYYSCNNNSIPLLTKQKIRCLNGSLSEEPICQTSNYFHL